MANGAIVLNLMCVERRETGLLLRTVFVDEAGFQLKQRRRQLDKATKYKQMEEKTLTICSLDVAVAAALA